MGKYCMNCGSEIEEGAKFCQNCGSSNFEEKNEVKVAESEINIPSSNETQSATNYNTQNTQTQVKKTNGLAIASLVCSLVGLIIATLYLGIIAICLSVSAKKKIALFNQGGKGMATAGLVIGIIDVAFGVLAIILRAAFNI